MTKQSPDKELNKKLTKKEKIITNISITITTIGCILAVMLLYLIGMKITFYRNYMVSSVSQYSMVPTLNLNSYLKYGSDYYNDPNRTEFETDYVFIRKNADVKRGDLISAEVNWNKDGVLKRLIGLGGDKIRIAQVDAQGNETAISSEVAGYNLLVIPKGETNEELIYYMPKKRYIGKDKDGIEQYLTTTRNYNLFLSFIYNPSWSENVYVDETSNKTYIYLKDDEIFFMGDNWEVSLDCLEKGPAKRHEIKGRVDSIVTYGKNLRIATFRFYSVMIFKNY